jgi:hypothetical protein
MRQLRSLCRDIGQSDPTDLIYLETIRDHAYVCIDIAVYNLRTHGYNDQQIGEALGITRQAVSKRWPGGGRYVGAAGRYRKPVGEADDVN